MSFAHGDDTTPTLTGHAVFDSELRRVGVVTDVALKLRDYYSVAA